MNKYAAFVLLMILTFAYGCMSIQTRQEIETELFNVIKQIEPMAKEKEDIRESLFQVVQRAKNGPASSKESDVAEMVKMQVSRSNGKIYQRNVNLDTQMRPYLDQLNRIKYNYIRQYGVIDYNNYIKSLGYEWGLGIYW